MENDLADALDDVICATATGDPAGAAAGISAITTLHNSFLRCPWKEQFQGPHFSVAIYEDSKSILVLTMQILQTLSSMSHPKEHEVLFDVEGFYPPRFTFKIEE